MNVETHTDALHYASVTTARADRDTPRRTSSGVTVAAGRAHRPPLSTARRLRRNRLHRRTPTSAATAVARRRGGYERLIKPVIDRALGGVALLILLPVLAMTAAAVWATLGRPVLYRQRRVGLDGHAFGMLKFRTMLPDRRSTRTAYDGVERRRTHKSTHDPRHTALGRFLRRWSLDELPQLWNVLRGELSLVGPRPELCVIVESYEAWQHRRHEVKPGVTGLWQVTARGDGQHMCEHVDLDLRYVGGLSLWTDLKILALTPPAVLGLRRGS